jgi:adenylate cyclase
MSLSLSAIRNCLEGVIPSPIATCAADGTPNITYLSQVHYVDEEHVALSYQFFNKTRQNVLESPRARVQVIEPVTAMQYRLDLQYLRTETEGPLFENMKARLAGIASHSGMTGVFRLIGADIYRVQGIEAVPGNPLPRPPLRRSALSALRACSAALSQPADLSTLFDQALAMLEQHFGFRHSMLMLLDERGGKLYTVASRGYENSGVGSEVALGEGVIGVAARERVAIRIGHAAREYQYNIAVRRHFLEGNPEVELETAIPFPGLPEPRSQLAVPLLLGQGLVGALYVESAEDLRFSYEDEEALLTFGGQLAMGVHIAQQAAEAQEAVPAPEKKRDAIGGAPLHIRHYAENDSVFAGDIYVIKGVAGSILWKLLRDHTHHGRSEFTNRELRVDPSIRLPEVSENLEARLILLQRRLSESELGLSIEKTGRGRFRFKVQRPLTLESIASGAR